MTAPVSLSALDVRDLDLIFAKLFLLSGYNPQGTIQSGINLAEYLASLASIPLLNARTSNAGASLVGVQDSGNRLGGSTTVEQALAYLASLLITPQVYSCPAGIQVSQGVYISGSLAVDLCDPSDSTKMPAVGFVVSKPTTTTCLVQKNNELGGFSGLVPGTRYWFDATTPGGITRVTPTHPNIEQQAGIAISNTALIIQLGITPIEQL